MTRQLDMIPTPIAEDADAMRRIDAMLPKAREVRGRRMLPPMFPADDQISRHDVGHEFVLPERAREDHR